MTTSIGSRFELASPLAIGTLQWGTTWLDDKVVNSKGVLSDETCRQILEVSKGTVTLVDTAEGYGGGTSEKRLGRLIQDDRILMTKFLPVPWRWSHSDFEWAVRQSCLRLQVDAIPIYLLHSPVHWRPLEFWIEAGAKCLQKGLIKSMGLSNCNADQVRRAVEAGRKFGVPVVCNQVHYSLLDYQSPALQEMERVCRELDVTIVAFSPIGQGLLTDSLTPERMASNKPARMLRLEMNDLKELRGSIKKMAEKYDKTMAQVALNWCIQHKVVPLVGCRSMEQAKRFTGMPRLEPR